MASKKHDFTATEIKAGFLVLAGALVFALFVAVVQGMRPPEKTHEFAVFFTDTGGLNKGADVRYGGVKAGRVKHIGPSAADQSQIEVRIAVRPDVPINEDSRAFITQTTLTSEKHLEITTGAREAAVLPPGAVIPTQAGGLFGELATVSGGLKDVMNDVRDLLGVQKAKAKDSETISSVADVLASVDGAVTESQKAVEDLHDLVNSRREDVTEILARLKDVLGSTKDLAGRLDAMVAENRDDVRGIALSGRETIEQIAELVDALSARFETMAAALQAALDNAGGLTGEARDLVETNRATIEDTLLDLRETVRYLKQFSHTLSEQPEAVIRGKNPEGRRLERP